MLPEPRPRAELPTFRREARIWEIAYHRKVIHLPPSKGLAYLANLVSEPGARIGASDLAGRARGDARAAAQDRVNVTKAIKAAIKKLAAQDPALGLHLELGVRTGAFCCYLPVLGIRLDGASRG